MYITSVLGVFTLYFIDSSLIIFFKPINCNAETPRTHVV